MIKQYTKKDGSTAYMFVAYLGVDPITGKQRRTTRRGFKSKREAKIAEAKLQNEWQTSQSLSSKKMHFKDVYTLWNEQYKNTVRESSLVVTTNLFTRHILPVFGNRYVSDITIVMCQRQLNDWHDKYAEYRKLKGYTKQVLDYAVSLGLINQNPMTYVKTPRSKQHDKKEELLYYTKEELKQFFELVQDDVMYTAVFRLLAFTGIRKGELLALQWKDIDALNQTITISKTVAQGQSSTVIQPPKTKNSHRTISIDQGTLDALARWKELQYNQLMSVNTTINDDTQLVFSNPHTNKHLSHMTIPHRYWSICEQNNFKRIKLHGFRHTHCTLLFESGASIQEVQQRLGHSDIKTTMNIYAHVTQNQRDQMAQKFAKYIDF